MNNKTPWYATTTAITAYVVAGVVITFGLVVAVIFGSVNNKYVNLTQNISNSVSNISKEEQRRVDLFNNLVDAIESYNKFEQSTLAQITQARSEASAGKIDQAQLTIQAVVEAYPQLKSQDNYKQAMLEFSITENRIAQYREQYNVDVRSFNSYVQKFPSSILLNIIGKDLTQKKYLDFKVDNSKATNLFN